MDQEDTSIVHTRSRDRELEQGLRGRKYCIREEIQLQRRDVMTDRKRRVTQAVQVASLLLLLLLLVYLVSHFGVKYIRFNPLCDSSPSKISRMMHTRVSSYLSSGKRKKEMEETQL